MVFRFGYFSLALFLYAFEVSFAHSHTPVQSNLLSQIFHIGNEFRKQKLVQIELIGFGNVSSLFRNELQHSFDQLSKDDENVMYQVSISRANFATLQTEIDIDEHTGALVPASIVEKLISSQATKSKTSSFVVSIFRGFNVDHRYSYGDTLMGGWSGWLSEEQRILFVDLTAIGNIRHASDGRLDMQGLFGKNVKPTASSVASFVNDVFVRLLKPSPKPCNDKEVNIQVLHFCSESSCLSRASSRPSWDPLKSSLEFLHGSVEVGLNVHQCDINKIPSFLTSIINSVKCHHSYSSSCWIDSDIFSEEVDNVLFEECYGITLDIPPDTLHIPVVYIDIGSFLFDRIHQTVIARGIIMSTNMRGVSSSIALKEPLQSICEALLEFIWGSQSPGRVRDPLTGLVSNSNSWIKDTNISGIQKDSIIQKEIVSQVLGSISSIHNICRQFLVAGVGLDEALTSNNLHNEVGTVINSINSILKRSSTYFMMSSYEQSLEIIEDFHEEAARLVHILSGVLEYSEPFLSPKF